MNENNKPDPLATTLMTAVEKAVGGVTNGIEPTDSGPSLKTVVCDAKSGKVKDGPASAGDVVVTVPVFHPRPDLPKPKPKPEPEPWRSDTEKFLRELNRTTGGTKRNHDEGIHTDSRPLVVNDMKKFVQYIMFHAATTADDMSLVTADQRKELLAIEAEIDGLRKQQARYSPGSANLDHAAQNHRWLEAVKAGKTDEAAPTRSRAEVQEDYTIRRNALEAYAVSITHERAIPLVKAVFDKLLTVVERFLHDVEERDREIADACGFGYRPSSEWRCAAHVALRFCGPNNLALPTAGTSKSPKAMLSELVDLEKEVA